MSKIAVAGIGYVGLGNAVALAKKNEVTLIDVIPGKVDDVNNGKSPIKDDVIEDLLVNGNLNLSATLDANVAYKDAEYVFIAAPTNYDEVYKKFDTSILEKVIKTVIEINPEAIMIIKSTIPVGYTEKVKEKFGSNNIIFSPEFLREGKAGHDVLNPKRIVVGEKSERAEKVADLLLQASEKNDVPIKLMNSTEAECVKLCANTGLAVRIAYFNELDTYFEEIGVDSKAIIEAMGLDPRIGDHYNNPSFGYGGYCLPKDTKQLLANYQAEGIPNSIIGAVVESNDTRKTHIANSILKMLDKEEKEEKVVGIHKLTMKADSDNFRKAAILDVIGLLQVESENREFDIVIYEPTLKEDEYMNCKVVKDIDEFKEMSDVIVTNRMDENLEDVRHKVYTRDLFNRD